MRTYLFSFVTLVTLASPSYILAEECKVTVGYTNNFLGSSENITRYEKYRVSLGSGKTSGRLRLQHINNDHRNSNDYLKHMRKVWNAGDFDVKVTYWTGLGGEKSTTVKKGNPQDSKKISGDLIKIECLQPSTATSCKLKGYFASRPLDPFHSGRPKNYDIGIGRTEGSRVERKHLRKIVNTGNLDARIEIRGLGPATWKRLNPGDDFIGQTDLQAINCIGGSSAKLSPIDKIQEDIDNAKRVYSHYRDSWDKIERLAKRDGEVINAPASCNLVPGRDFYKNRYMGSPVNLGSQKKFYNLSLSHNFSPIDNYLLMQAAGKTYYDQIRFKHRAAQTDTEFMCGAQELYNHWGFTKVQFATTKLSANAIIASNRDAVVIAVRGTQSPAGYDTGIDIIKGALDVAANAIKVTVPAIGFGLPSPGLVHTGYAVNALLLSKQIEVALSNIDNIRRKKIYVTGHSLGASTAILLSYFMQTKSPYKPTATYAFASPEVGNERLTRDLYGSSRYYLTNNYRDPIPNVNRKPYKDAVIGPLLFSSALFASREITYFKGDAEHSAKVFPNRYSSRRRKQEIAQIQGDLPYAFFSHGRAMSPEWHFHSPNFYIAHTYSEVLRNQFRKLSGTGILPEFSNSKLCISSNGRTARDRRVPWDGNAPYELLKSDKQPNRFIKGSCTF